MNVTVIGTGYVGLVTGTCLADLGNNVLCMDVDATKIKNLKRGKIPIYEPGLDALVESNIDAERLQFSTSIEEAVNHGEIIFIAVGTPPDEDGSADLQYVLAAARQIGSHMADGEFKVVVNKSTVPVGTADRVRNAIEEVLLTRGLPPTGFAVVSNPEFLKEGAAVADFMRPDRIVLGVDETETGQRARRLMRQLYAPFNRNHERMRVMDIRSAELTKYAANAMLATRISFMNELARLAEKVGADIKLVRQAIGSAPRIGSSFLYAGAGYGGSGFPKDVQALVRTAMEHGLPLRVLDAVEKVNNEQKSHLTNKLFAHFGNVLAGKTVAVWGLAFKPNTNDMREAPSRGLITSLLRAGANLQVHDPVATSEAKHALAQDLADAPELNNHINFAGKPFEAVEGADALVVVTEWKAYRSPNLTRLKALMKAPTVFDGRNLYEPALMREAGFQYFGVGRGL